MSDSDFLTEVRAAFEYLEAAHDFQLKDYQPAGSFDNATVDFSSAALRITVGRERGQVFIEVGSAAGGGQYDLHLLARLLGDPELERCASMTAVQARDLAPALEPHLPRLTLLFSPREQAQTETRLEALKRARADELFGPAP